MVRALRRFLRALRSRRLAVSLIAFLAVYSIIGTLVPRGLPDEPAVRAWASAHPLLEAVIGPLGLHRAYTSPLFLTFALLLAACTVACAIERTNRARTVARGMREPSEGMLERLRNRPQADSVVAEGIEPRAALAETAVGLERLGLRVRRGPNLVEGLAGGWGVSGSPLFHWSIVALMLVAAAGQATRAEGFLGLPLGERVADERASYLQITEGPLFGQRFTGVEFVASDLVRGYRVGGVDFGPAPVVTASRDGVRLAAGRVYPNSPLRVGSLLVHMADVGPAAVVALESAGGAEIGRTTLLLDRSSETSSGTRPSRFSFVGGAGAPPIDARIQVIVHRTPAAGPTEPLISRAIVETSAAGSGSFGTPLTLVVGEFLPLPGGRRLRLVDVKDWVRVSVANDWSIAPLYALFGTAIVGLALAVLVPARRASVLLVEDEEGWSLHVGTWHARRDPAFRRRVEDAVRKAAGGQEDS